MHEHSPPQSYLCGTHRALTPCPTPATGTIHILIVEATSPAGGVPVLPEGVSELLVEGVSEAAGDALPGQDEDDDHGVLAVVACPVPHQAEQLLFQRVPADHLWGGGEGGRWEPQESSARARPQRTPHTPLCPQTWVQLFWAVSQGSHTLATTTTQAKGPL